MRQRIKEWLDNWAISRFKSIMPKELITSLYKRIASNDLQIHTRIVTVKKGKIRYKLLITHSNDLKTVHNLGRHNQQEPKLRAA